MEESKNNHGLAIYQGSIAMEDTIAAHEREKVYFAMLVENNEKQLTFYQLQIEKQNSPDEVNDLKTWRMLEEKNAKLRTMVFKMDPASPKNWGISKAAFYRELNEFKGELAGFGSHLHIQQNM